MTSPQPAPTSATPRPLTAAAVSQSWRELPVRTWTALTVGLVLVILAVGVRGLITGLEDRNLLAQGLRLNGKIDVIAGARTNASRSVQREITLSFQMPEETERRVLEKQILEPEANAPPISWGDTLPILVDRKDPRKWTSRLHPASWIVVMAVPLLLAPLAILFALITRTTRRRLLHLHANGILRSAKVGEAHRSPLIPGQKVAKFTVGGRTLAAAYPDALGPIAAGDAIDLIIDNEAKPSRAIVARAYESTMKDRAT
jgi:hypothetical protein